VLTAPSVDTAVCAVEYDPAVFVGPPPRTVIPLLPQPSMRPLSARTARFAVLSLFEICPRRGVVQCPTAQICPVAHAVPQAPQLFTSVSVLGLPSFWVVVAERPLHADDRGRAGGSQTIRADLVADRWRRRAADLVSRSN
jgi:hypothetical protein